MDEEQEGQGHKISLPEGIIILLVFIIIDAIEVAIVFFALDDFWILDTISSAIFLYLYLRGVPAIYQLITWLAELIPYVGALPLLTVGWIITWWVDAHPKSVAGQAVTTAATLAPTGASAIGKTAAVAGEAEQAAGAAQKIEGGAREIGSTAAAGAGAAEGITKEAEGGAPKAKEIPGEALGERKSVFEEMEEPFENLPESQPAKPKEEEYNDEEGVNEAETAPPGNVLRFTPRGTNGGKNKNKEEVEVDDNGNVNLAA